MFFRTTKSELAMLQGLKLLSIGYSAANSLAVLAYSFKQNLKKSAGR